MLYSLFNTLGLVAATAYMYCMLPKYEIKRLRGMLFFGFTYVTIYALMLLLHWLMTGETEGQNIIRTFVFEPFIVWYYAKVFDLKSESCMDLAAVASCISIAFAKIGCAFAGCCESWLQVPWGLYNEYTNTRLFPVQIAESLTAFGVAILVHFMSKKHNYRNQGRCMPWMLILFCSTRVLWKFLKVDKKVFLCFSELALWNIAAVLLGAIWLIIDTLRKSKERGGTKCMKF